MQPVGWPRSTQSTGTVRLFMDAYIWRGSARATRGAARSGPSSPPISWRRAGANLTPPPLCIRTTRVHFGIPLPGMLCSLVFWDNLIGCILINFALLFQCYRPLLIFPQPHRLTFRLLTFVLPSSLFSPGRRLSTSLPHLSPLLGPRTAAYPRLAPNLPFARDSFFVSTRLVLQVQ